MTEIERLESVIALLQVKLKRSLKNPDCFVEKLNDEFALKTAIKSLEEKKERLENKPLTIDELRKIERQPIFIKHILGEWKHDGWHIVNSCEDGVWGLVLKIAIFSNRTKIVDHGDTVSLENYGKTWLAYRYELS